MIIYPAIDILEGKCVRLMQGKYDKSTVYGENTEEIAKRWERQGAKYLHIVDLDGAKMGRPVNVKSVISIIKNVSIPVQLGGGIRSPEDVEMYLGAGVKRLILGTAVIKDLSLVKDLLLKYRERIVIGIDAKGGFAATDGWENISNQSSVSLAKEMQKLGARTIIYTDIATDGMLTGPNIGAMEEMVKQVDIDVIASGGVASAADIKGLDAVGVSGVIVGKALYNGNINLAELMGGLK